MNKSIVMLCLLWAGCAAPVREPAPAPAEHSVLVLPPATEKRIADLEKFAASFPGPSVLELQEHVRSSEKQITVLQSYSTQLDKLVARIAYTVGEFKPTTEADRPAGMPADKFDALEKELAELKKRRPCPCCK